MDMESRPQQESPLDKLLNDASRQVAEHMAAWPALKDSDLTSKDFEAQSKKTLLSAIKSLRETAQTYKQQAADSQPQTKEALQKDFEASARTKFEALGIQGETLESLIAEATKDKLFKN